MNRIRIHPVHAADLRSVGRLFTYYPYKTGQQAVQRIDRQRLEAYFQERLAKAVAEETPHWIALDGKQTVGLAGLAENRWHSAIYGMKMGRVEPWLNTIRPEAGRALILAVERAARRGGFQHLALRLDGADFPNLHLLEAAGWRTMDVSVKYSLPMPIKPVARQRRREAKMRVGLVEPEDAAWIRRIGSTTHTASHFLNDPALDPKKTNELFSRWLNRCLELLAYRIYTMKNDEGEGLGFVTLLRNEAFAEAIGRRPLVLDFVLLDPSVRGRGLGPWLIEEALKRENASGFDYCELRTSMHNLEAVGCYEKLQFQCCSVDFQLHKSL
jgi:GNAT superfamily N-acetyltransferase